jgi:hypothetical protein
MPERNKIQLSERNVGITDKQALLQCSEYLYICNFTASVILHSRKISAYLSKREHTSTYLSVTRRSPLVTFCYASFLPLIELSGKKWTF